MANCFLRLLSYNVIIVSIAMFALSIANLTVQCSDSNLPLCDALPSTNPNAWLYTMATQVFFLAIGIWASVPCLLSGLGTLRSLGKPSAGRNWLWATTLAGAFFFTPLLVIFSAFNATSAMAMINASSSPATTPMTVAFALPLTVAILAGLVHLHLLLFICAGCQGDESTVQVVEVAKVVQAPSPVQPEPVLRSTAWHVSAPAASCGCNHAYGQSPYGR